MKSLFAALVVTLAGPALAAEVCAAARLRDTTLLATAAAQDKVLAASFQRAATACAERGDACDQARVECGGLLTSLIQKQINFDEGMWLRDLLLPYLGQQYSPTRTFGTFTLAPDASCNVDVASLLAASQRRQAQAARREGLFQEYALFAKWTETVQQQCRDRDAVEQQKSATVKAQSEQIAAVATAATAAELARKKAEADAKSKADEDARRLREAQELAAKQAVEQAKQRDLAIARAKQDQLDAEARAQKAQLDAEARNRQLQMEDEQRMKAEREQAQKTQEEKARLAEEQRFIKEREQKAVELKTYKKKLVAEAEATYKLALAEEESRRQAAVEAVSQSPAIAQAAVAQAADAERNRINAEHALAEARLKAERIEVDESFERSRGHLAALGGGGAFAYSNDTGSVTGGGLGAMITAHLGFWGQAPAAGLANGFEVALGARFFQALGTGAPREIEGHATARYFFGPLGVGLAGEGRSVDASLGVRAFGLGPSIGIAAVDTPHTRVIFSANWLPVGTAIDLTRITGEFEVSYEWFIVRVLGGSFAQQLSTGTTVGWQAAAFVGARLSW